MTQGEEDVHSFSWSADSHTIYFATRQPWSKTQKDDYKKVWKDVMQYRTAERGDTIFALDLAAALARHAAAPTRADTPKRDDDKDPDLTPGTVAIAKSPLRVEHLITSPDGATLAFLTQRHQPAPGKIRRRRNLHSRSERGAGTLAHDCRR